MGNCCCKKQGDNRNNDKPQGREKNYRELTQSAPDSSRRSGESEESISEPPEPKRTMIDSPEHIAFELGTRWEVIDGFTPGALKNIVTISSKFIRVYAVTESSINFIS